jgi:interferon-induced transmembrane protein
MYCTNCGKPRDPNAAVCAACGKPFERFGAASGTPQQIPNYLVQSILVTLCCCLPFGIVAIVYSAQVNPKLAAGDMEGALDASAKAKMWAWISFGCGAAFSVLYGILMAVGAIQQ